MFSVDRLKKLLGSPSGGGDRVSLRAAEASLGVELPQELKEVCSLYGDVMISDYILIFGPQFMAEKNLWMSEFVREGHPVTPKAVLPEAGGMIHWGHSIEGDKFFSGGSRAWQMDRLSF